uniref:Reverse transcriptase Ty1/copia-type domain-containing protein n=1 Tax=Solanum lycopersicum TaxID=4081 RepID=A0A3Q7FMB1_SOLLC
MTRPDISYGVKTLSQFLQHPKKSHVTATLRIVRYVKNQPRARLGLLPPNKKVNNWLLCSVWRVYGLMEVKETNNCL